MFKRFSFITVLVLTACGEPSTNNTQNNTTATNELVGCYAITKNTSAQIKISHDTGYAMQMKELDGSGQTWDKPEPLEVLSKDKAWEFFKVNALDLQSTDISHVIARPDGVMALAKLNSTITNINPLLDSEYVVHLFHDVSTIYQVPCDDVSS